MNKQVLVVDDDAAITEGLIALFEIEQIQARGAYDREAAEAIIEAEFYPIILADLRLRTEEDGLKLIDAIRAKSPLSRVATMTAYATPALEAELQRRGSKIVLYKPLPFDEILAVVTEMLAEIEREAAAQEARGVELDLPQLYADVHKILFSVAQRRYRFSAEESEDLVQEAWYLFLKRRQSVRLPRPWLAGTIANLCRQQIQDRTRSREINPQIGPEAGEIAGEQGGSFDNRIMIKQALARIDDRARQLCVLIGMEGWSYEEVARELALPIGSIGPLYIRAKRKLRKALTLTN
jgi:RNA polymerase sigma factor (sigma-70 family)